MVKQGAPAAIAKLKANKLDVNKLIKAEIAAILFGAYHVMMNHEKILKPALVKELEERIKEDKTKLDAITE